MATFKVVVRSVRSDGVGLVYIRCTHNRMVAYIKTDMYLHKTKIKNKEIIDQSVLTRCLIQIDNYYQKLNRENILSWTAKEVTDFLKSENTKIPFYPFCEKYIDKLINNGQIRNAQSYRIALNSFQKHFTDRNITFQLYYTISFEIGK